MTDGFQIGTVARLTGLSPDTIRAWERRYALISPGRNGIGLRVYSGGDVARLELARAAVALGHTIGRVATLDDAEIRALIDATQSTPARPLSEATAATRAIDEIVDAIHDYDLIRAEELLNAAALLFTPAGLIVDVLAPLMNEIGARWERGSLSVAQEHFASHLVRSLVGSMSRMRPPSGEESMLFLTPSDELHEFGILFAAALASLHGFKTLVLGASVPAEELVRAARTIAPNRIVIGVVYGPHQREILDYIDTVQRGVAPHTKIVLGGEAARALPAEQLPAGVEIYATLSDFASRIGRPAR